MSASTYGKFSFSVLNKHRAHPFKSSSCSQRVNHQDHQVGVVHGTTITTHHYPSLFISIHQYHHMPSPWQGPHPSTFASSLSTALNTLIARLMLPKPASPASQLSPHKNDKLGRSLGRSLGKVECRLILGDIKLNRSWASPDIPGPRHPLFLIARPPSTCSQIGNATSIPY